ncbi:MAG: alginate lyase family protein [Actinomycetota bacterium]|nr:alginate lyase family protein [Actinomycetota bacterium]
MTRGEFARRAAVLTVPAALGASSFRIPLGVAATAPQSPFVLTASELAQVRRNIFDLKLPFTRRAWANTVAKADGWLGYEPSPTRSDADVSDWREAIYLPGLYDGVAAVTLATAYAVGRRSEHGVRAKAICLAWARTYRPAPPLHKIGHMVAEPVGPVIKLCMAYDLAKPVFTRAERAQFTSWAAQFVERGRINADYARDRPWVPDVTYGDDRANVAPYGNSATWQRAMAVFAAAVVGGSTLRQTLEWNLQHTTAGGLDYGWDNVLEGLVIDGSGGQLIEERYRSSIEYGQYSWVPLILIANVARNVRFRVDLFEYRTKRHGYTIFSPFPYYAGFLTSSSIPDSLEKTVYGGAAWPTTTARWRAVYEVLYRNASDPKLVKKLHNLVNYGGPRQRGDNYDIRIVGHAALFGRGPNGP